MSIREQILQVAKVKPRLTVVNKWLLEAEFDVAEFRQVAASGEFTASALLIWARNNGFDGGETNFRKWVRECQSGTN